MTARRRAARLSIAGVLALVLGAAFSVANAAANPIWEFNGTTLSGQETILGSAVKASMTIPGLTTTCDMDFDMTIWNSLSGGEGSVTAFSFANCHTNSASCTVASIQALGLPWPALLVKVSSSNYLAIKGIQIDLLYSGDECVLADIPVEVMGTAAGLIDNSTESAIFNSSSASATASKVLALGTTVQLQGSFELQATGSHSGQSLAVL